MELEIVEQLMYMNVKSNIYQSLHKQKGIWFANFAGFLSKNQSILSAQWSWVYSPVQVLM